MNKLKEMFAEITKKIFSKDIFGKIKTKRNKSDREVMECNKANLANLPVNNKLVFWLGIAVTVAFIIFIIIFNLPTNRANRALAKGKELYSEGDFSKASEKFLKSVTIKSDLWAAYDGLILSDFQTDLQKAKEDFAMADAEIVKVKDTITEENRVDVIQIYLLAPELFSDTPDQLIKYMENGYAVTGESPDLKTALADSYVLMATELKDSDIESAVEYDLKARAILNSPSGMEDDISSEITKFIYELVESDEFDKAYAAVDKYKELYSIETVKITSDIDASRDLYDTKVSLLKEVYNLMEQYYNQVTKPASVDMYASDEVVIGGMADFDFSIMFEYDGSEEAEKLATSMTQNAYIYAPGYNRNYTGIACGLYPYGEPFEIEEGKTGMRYYFFFGEYKNGVRDGYGFSFAEASDNSFVGFEGMWKNDSPNGFGACIRNEGINQEAQSDYKSVSYGNFADGRQNGVINVRAIDGKTPEILFTGSYEASDGDAGEAPVSTEVYEILDEIPEDYKLISVLPSTTEEYNIYLKIFQKNGEKLSALGF